jgi:pantothenate kinase
MHDTYNSLADRLIEASRSSVSKNRQYWVCLAGGPGAGKSTLSAAVVSRLNQITGDPSFSVVLPMDGFHYSRQQLREISERPGQPSYDDLIARRGSPWTFDAPAICTALTEARRLGRGSLPTYSRKLSDPVPGGVDLLENHKVVVVEGNYMLNYDDPLWAPLKDLFDERWYLSCASMEDQRQRLIKRHLETWSDEKTRMWGAGEEGAAKKADANDVLNAQFIESSAKYADLKIISL